MKSTVLLISFFIFFFQFETLIAQNCTSLFSFDMVGVNVAFMDQSTTTGSPIVSWNWNFGDGSSSNQQNPVHVFPGQDEYVVCLTITTANNCSDQFCFDLEICHMTVTVTQTGDCNSNGEIPIRIFITDMYDNARDVNVSIDGNLVPGSPFRVREDEPVTINTFVPGDGLSHVIAVISEDVEGCQVIQDFQSEDCTSDCFISGMALQFSGGATHTINVGGNFFQPVNQTILIGDLVNFQFIDGGHTTTSDATTGPDSWSSGELGFGATYPVYITNPGTHRYYCQPHGGPNGNGMSGMIIANCPPGGQNPVQVSFNTSIANPAGYNIRVDGVNIPGSPFMYSGTGPNSQIITIAGDGMAHTVEVQDVAEPTCINTRTYNAPDCGAAPACNISFSGAQSGGCANNQVPYQLTIATINGSAQGFQVLVNNVLLPGGPFPYNSGGNTLFTVQLPGNGQSQTVRVRDSQDVNCFGEQMFTTPNCSAPCNISNVTISSGSAVTHTVQVRDFDFFPPSIQITNGDIIDFFWTGVVPHTSTSDVGAGPNTWNSGLLNQGAHYMVTITDPGNYGYYCLPHGAPGGVGMAGTITAVPPCNNGLVSVLVTFQASNAGFTGFNILVDGNMVSGGPFPYDDNNGINSIPVLVPGNGMSHVILIQDAETTTCSASNNITTPDCNASFCEINVTAQQNGTCNQGNVSVNLTIQSLNGGSTGFTVTSNGVPVAGSPFQYTGNNTVVPITLMGNGQTYTIAVADVADASCTAQTSLASPDCNLPCSINNLSVSAGQQVTHVVDVRDFDFSPAAILINVNDIVRFNWTGAVPHTSTSDLPSGPNSWSSGLQGQGFQYDVTITEIGVHPYYCAPHGAPGGVGMAGTITAAPPCNDGFVQVSLQFGFVNGGSGGYNVLVDGQIIPGSPFDYPASGPVQQSVAVPGDGENHLIEVRDVAGPACQASVNLVTPDCNVSFCQLNVQANQNGACNQGSVPVSVTVSAINPGNAGFIVLVDGQPVNGNPFQYQGANTTVNIQVVGDGSSHSIIVRDVEDNACTNTAQVTTSDCNLPCQISNLQVSAGQSVTHTVQVRDFDFNPQHISINTGDAIDFIWTGVIAHTATTDLPSGPGSWNSGLQGQGFEYSVTFEEVGVVPYYCIPHGAPGGVGMAGTVSVTPPCVDGFVQVSTSFEFSNPGAGGYRVFVDNVEISGSPFPYPSGNSVQISVSVTGDAQLHQIKIQDASQSACFSTAQVTTPDCGVSLCQLSVSTVVTGPCTPQQTLPVNVSVNALNPAGTSFNLYLNNILYTGSPFNYGTQGATIIPILVSGNGQTHVIRVEDFSDPTCQAQTSLGVSDCNDPCVLTNLTLSTGSPVVHVVGVEDFQFDPQFIDINAGDTVQFIWTGVIPHTATSSVSTGPGSFNSGLQGPGFVYEVPFAVPGEYPYYCEPHGTPSGIGMAGTITVNNNCTNNQVQVAISFQANNVGVQGYLVFVDGTQVSGPHAYVSGPIQSNTVAVAGDGMSHTIEIRDADYADCKIISSITTPLCGGGNVCQINATANVGTVCDAQNRVQVTLTVSHQNVSTTGFDVLVDGVTFNAQPIPYTSGSQTVYVLSLAGTGTNKQMQIRDAVDASCNDTLQITLPSCGVACAIEQLAVNAGPGVHEVQVRDYDYLPQIAQIQLGDTVRFVWTGAIPHTVTSDILSGPGSFNSGLLSTGATFDVIPGNAGTVGYFCIPHGGPGGIGMAGSIQVSGGSECVGDTAVLSIQFAVTNGSPLGYWVYQDGVKLNAQPITYQNQMGLNQTTIRVIGDGSPHFLTVQDVESPGCAATALFETPLCGAGCAILDMDLNTGENIVHRVEVRDFDYLPENILIRTGETVLFDFTGVIPHTVTSDALQGPDVFNSGILGQGAAYEVTIQQTGAHPYYCIPHGGPSGIGMAGSIQANLSCENGLTALQVKFRVTNGSAEGYRIYLDGVLLPGSPFIYDDRRGENVRMLFLQGDGQQHIITIQDLDNPICAASGFVFLQNCAQNCSFNQVQVAVSSGREHEVLVRDFDFEPLTLQVEPGDLVVFNWTGVVPHTVTSDNSSGPGSFNSGLLGQGAQYTLPVLDPGTISYYCIPHGSPGGIGMAGLITSTAACDDDTLSMQLTFQTATGKTGFYQIMINGMLYPGGPIPYNASGNQLMLFSIPGDGVERTLSIIDLSDPTCFTQTSFVAPDCDNPCFELKAGFNFAVDINSKSVQFTNTSTGTYDEVTWTFGDGGQSGELSPNHTYAADGSYQVCLFLENSSSGCRDTICKTVFIGGFICQANFDFDGKGLAIQFEDLSITSSPVMLRTWSFGDNNITLNVLNPLHTYAGLGIYEVCLTVKTAECESTICKTIDLSNPCVLFQPDFEYVPDQNQGFQFVDLTEGEPDNWLWGFGDGSTSNEKNPFHRYNTGGNYKVCLLVQREQDFCSKFLCKEIQLSTGIFSTRIVNHKLKVFPNPVPDGLTEVILEGVLDLDLNKRGIYLIYDAMGRTAQSGDIQMEKSTSLPLSHKFVKGIYFLELKLGERIYYASFMYQ